MGCGLKNLVPVGINGGAAARAVELVSYPQRIVKLNGRKIV